jgi:hypothetical protein
VLFQNPADNSQITHCVSIINIAGLMMFREIIIAYSENHTKHVNAICGKVSNLLTLIQVIVLRADTTLPFKVFITISFKFQVSVTTPDDNFYWCKIFKLPRMRRKHHMVRVSVILTY